jgi:hypothetical protein
VTVSLLAAGFVRGLLGILAWKRTSGEDVGGAGGISLRFRFGVELDSCEEGGGGEEKTSTSAEVKVVILTRDTCKGFEAGY